MEKKKYPIGDVAAMVGVSRDTLRFYEKKGVTSVRKKEDGYRYYSEDDVSALPSISYYRKMNIGLEEIESLWKDDSSFGTSAEITKRQVETEEEEISKRQQALVQLHLFQGECRKIEQNLNQISLKSFPKAYIIETRDSPQDSVITWSCKSQRGPGFDMLYTYDTYRVSRKTGSDTPEFQQSFLLLYEKLTDTFPFSPDLKRYEKTKTPECLCAIIESQSRVPDMEMIRDMTAQGGEHQVKAGDIAVSDYVVHGIQDGTFIFYLEVCIPILR